MLLVALVLLALMTLTGSSVMESVTAEFRLTAGLKERSQAFEATEGAVLQGVSAIRAAISSGADMPDAARKWFHPGGLLPVSGTTQPTDNVSALQFWWSYALNNDNSRVVSGGETGASEVRYLIERLVTEDEAEPVSASTYPLTFYRITALGKGSSGAEVMVQNYVVQIPR